MSRVSQFIADLAGNKINWRFLIIDLVKRFYLVETASVVGAVSLGVFLIAFLFKGMLSGTRSQVQAARQIELNDDIHITSRGGELRLGEFQVVLSSLSIQQSSDRSGGSGTIQIVEMEAMALLKTVEKKTIVIFHSRLKNHTYRIRQLFDESIRTSTRKQLVEPDLASLRQRILTGMNKMLKTTLIEEIVFSHFRAVHVPISQFSLLRIPLPMNTFRELATVTNDLGNIRKEPTRRKKNGPKYQNFGPQWKSSLGFAALVTERNFCLDQPSFWNRRRLLADSCKGRVG